MYNAFYYYYNCYNDVTICREVGTTVSTCAVCRTPVCRLPSKNEKDRLYYYRRQCVTMGPLSCYFDATGLYQACKQWAMRQRRTLPLVTTSSIPPLGCVPQHEYCVKTVCKVHTRTHTHHYMYTTPNAERVLLSPTLRSRVYGITATRDQTNIPFGIQLFSTLYPADC